jgi:hypothetical protein
MSTATPIAAPLGASHDGDVRVHQGRLETVIRSAHQK